MLRKGEPQFALSDDCRLKVVEVMDATVQPVPSTYRYLDKMQSGRSSCVVHKGVCVEECDSARGCAKDHVERGGRLFSHLLGFRKSSLLPTFHLQSNRKNWNKDLRVLCTVILHIIISIIEGSLEVLIWTVENRLEKSNQKTHSSRVTRKKIHTREMLGKSRIVAFFQ